jgi:hypothetical protein
MLKCCFCCCFFIFLASKAKIASLSELLSVNCMSNKSVGTKAEMITQDGVPYL